VSRSPARRRAPRATATGGADQTEPLYERLVALAPVSRFDRWVDEAVERGIRGNPVADRVFYAASAVGDHGIIWLILALVRGLRCRDTWGAILRMVGAIGIESVVVNGPVKWLFRRQRPVPRAITPHPLRRPRTSSFPSGHATSAFCAATLLCDGDPAMAPVYFGLAAVVAWSRVHVRVHHASDTMGGVAIGLLLGQAFKRLLPLAPAGGRTSPSRPDASRESRPAASG
jgi:undecaprenyl-diphosphatase